MIRKHLSSIAIIIVAVTCIWNSFNETRWNRWGVIMWDAACYYAYLTKTFNHKTDEITPDEKRMPGLSPMNKYVEAPNGNKVLKTTMGMAILYSPFYAVGYMVHTINHGHAGTGVEVEYRRAMQFFGTFYLLLALVLMRRLLKRYFADGVVALTLLMVALGTNAFYYTTYESAMAHVPNMALFLLFLLVTEKWYAHPSIMRSITLGLLAGLLTLVRPTNILIGIFFLFWDAGSLSFLKERLFFLFSKWKLLLLMAVMAVLVWVPQMLYWYNLTGHFYFYSYIGEEFYFLHPNIYNGLFSWRKGWLIYTPVGVLMLLGFAFMHRYARPLLLPAALFYLLHTWVIFSWWCWWYGGSFSCRPMVEAYAILALPLASLLQFVFVQRRSITAKIAFGVLLLLLMSLNLFQTWQAKKVIIHYYAMTREAYMAVFLRQHQAPESMLEGPDWKSAERGLPTR